MQKNLVHQLECYNHNHKQTFQSCVNHYLDHLEFNQLDDMKCKSKRSELFLFESTL